MAKLREAMRWRSMKLYDYARLNDDGDMKAHLEESAARL